MRIGAVAIVLVGLSLTAAPGMVMSLLQIFHLQRLALSAVAPVAFYGFYLAGLAVAVLPMVALGARLGARDLFLSSVVALAATLVLLWLPFGLFALLGVRLLQGMAVAGLLVASFTLLRKLFGETRLALALACAVAATTLGYGMMPLLGGLGMNALGGFGVILPALLLCGVAFGFGRTLLPPSDMAVRPFDALGSLLAVLCLGALLAAMNLSPFRPLLALVLLLLGLVVLGFWLWQQARRVAPMLPLDLLARPVIGCAVAAAILCALATASSNLVLMSNMPASVSADPGRVGAILAFGSLAGALLALGIGWRFGRAAWHFAAIAGAALVACGLAAAAWRYSEASWIAAVLAGALGRAVFDVGNGMRIFGAAPRERSLAAAGLIVLSGALGNLLGPYVTTVLPWQLAGLPVAEASMPVWLGIAFVSALLALLLSLAVRPAAPAAT